MLLERNLVGQITLNDGKVDITDPCYDKDTWCRMTVDVKPGTYNCYSYIGEDRAWGKRVWINQIVIADGEDATIAEEKIRNNKSWKKIGEIGVDAGLAGFFDNKPNFNDDEWQEFCDWMRDIDEGIVSEKVYDSFINLFDGRSGFWTGSGVGDGLYSVYTIKNSGKIVALEIRF